MILLDTAPQHVPSLFLNWEFWVAGFTVISGFVTSYFKIVGIINASRIEMEHMDEKYDARMNSMKERYEADRDSTRANHEKLYALCEQMNQRLANMEGKLNGQGK